MVDITFQFSHRVRQPSGPGGTPIRDSLARSIPGFLPNESLPIFEPRLKKLRFQNGPF
jgi:hypothetical protein